MESFFLRQQLIDTINTNPYDLFSTPGDTNVGFAGDANNLHNRATGNGGYEIYIEKHPDKLKQLQIKNLLVTKYSDLSKDYPAIEVFGLWAQDTIESWNDPDFLKFNQENEYIGQVNEMNLLKILIKDEKWMAASKLLKEVFEMSGLSAEEENFEKIKYVDFRTNETQTFSEYLKTNNQLSGKTVNVYTVKPKNSDSQKSLYLMIVDFDYMIRFLGFSVS